MTDMKYKEALLLTQNRLSEASDLGTGGPTHTHKRAQG